MLRLIISIGAVIFLLNIQQIDGNYSFILIKLFCKKNGKQMCKRIVCAIGRWTTRVCECCECCTFQLWHSSLLFVSYQHGLHKWMIHRLRTNVTHCSRMSNCNDIRCIHCPSKHMTWRCMVFRYVDVLELHILASNSKLHATSFHHLKCRRFQCIFHEWRYYCDTSACTNWS